MQELPTPYVFERIVAPVSPSFPRNGEGDVIQLADGRLLMVYGRFEGGGDASPATLQGMVSDDNGRNWAPSGTVQENVGGCNVMSASLHRAPDGDLLLLFLRKDEPRTVCTPFLRRSADEGETWSEPHPVAEVGSGYYVVNNDRIVMLEGGRLLIPAHHNVDIADRRGGDVVFCSDDGGRKWTASPSNPFFAHSKSGPQEPGVVELKDGRVMMWCRCDLGEIYCCFSSDGGETFGDWRPGGLAAPCAPASIRRLPSTGELLCVFNHHATPPEYWAQTRSPLTAAVSSDEGESWRIAGDLEPDRTLSYCYKSITFLPAGEVLLTYYLGKDEQTVADGRLVRMHKNLAHLKVAVFEEKWLYEGSA